MTVSMPRRYAAAGRAWWHGSLGGHGLRRVRELDLDVHALALCAQQVLCTAPLLVAISAVMQRLQGHGIGVEIAGFFGLDHHTSSDVTRLFGHGPQSVSTIALLISMILAVVFATSVAAVQQRGFELIWTLPRQVSVASTIRQLIWAPALALFSLGILAGGYIAGQVDRVVDGSGSWVALLLQGIVTFLFYWWSQYWLLGGRVAWRALAPGAIGVAVLIAAMVRVSRLIVPGQISWQVNAYGLIGAVFVLSIWLMALSAVIFGGVLIGALITQRRDDPDRRPLAELANHPLTLLGLESAAKETEQSCIVKKVSLRD